MHFNSVNKRKVTAAIWQDAQSDLNASVFYRFKVDDFCYSSVLKLEGGILLKIWRYDLLYDLQSANKLTIELRRVIFFVVIQRYALIVLIFGDALFVQFSVFSRPNT